MSMTNVMNGMIAGANETANAAEQAAAWLGQNEQVTEPTEQKPYTLRALCAKDVFPMVKIIRKIGLKDIGKAFNPEEIKAITESVSEEENATVDSIAETVGVAVVLKIVDVILENLEAAEQEIFIKGNWIIELEQYALDISKLQAGIAIASSDVRRIKSISVNAESVMTIENKTSFQRLRDGKFAMMYLGGFANRDQIEFLKKVISDNPNIKYYHFGDIDIGGFLIHKHLCRETSKSFAKELMKKYAIPTAAYEVFTNYDEALAYIKTKNLPIVLKYDGLAAGKGVIIAKTYEEAEKNLYEMLVNKEFGEAKVVIEDFLVGEEFSYMCFVNGTKVYKMIPARDYKRIYDNDTGLNTGGMGAFTNLPFLTNDDISYEIGITMPGDKMNIVVFRQLTDGWHAFNYEVVMNA